MLKLRTQAIVETPSVPAVELEKKKFLPEEYFELKANIHNRLLDIVDLEVIDRMDRETLTAQIRSVVEKLLMEDPASFPLNLQEREKIFDEIVEKFEENLLKFIDIHWKHLMKL